MDRLEKIADDVVEIKVQLTKNTVLLAEHMRRTAANEARINTVEKFVEKHATVRQMVVTVGACLAGIAGFLYSVLKIIEFFTK